MSPCDIMRRDEISCSALCDYDVNMPSAFHSVPKGGLHNHYDHLPIGPVLTIASMVVYNKCISIAAVLQVAEA